MKLYMIKGVVEEKEKCLGFVGTKQKASNAMKNIGLDNPDIDSVWCEDTNVPTDKTGLLEWLNSYSYLDLKETK